MATITEIEEALEERRRTRQGRVAAPADAEDFERAMARRRAARAAGPQEPPGILTKVFGGLALGATRSGVSSLLGPLFRPGRAVIEIPGASERVQEILDEAEFGPGTAQRLENRLQGSTISDISEVVGEFLPDIITGGIAINAGRALALRAAQPIAERGLLGAGGRIMAQRGLASLNQLPKLLPVTRTQRAVQIAGGSAALGGLVGAEQLAEERTPQEAATSAALVTLFAAGIETAFTVVGRRLFKRAIDRDREPILRQFRETAKKFEGKLPILSTKIESIHNTVERMIGAVDQHAALLRARGFGPQEVFEVSKRQLPLIEKTQQSLNLLKAERDAIRNFIASDPMVIFTRNLPFNPTGVRLLLQQAGFRITKSAEGSQGEFGPTFARAFDVVRTAENRSTIGQSAHEKLILEAMEKVRRAMGFSRGRVNKERDLFLPLYDAWQTGLESGVRRYMKGLGRSEADIVAVNRIWRDLTERMTRKFDDAVAKGAEAPMDPRDFGLLAYGPHLLDSLPEEELIKRLTKAAGEGAVSRWFPAGANRMVRRFESLDFQRRVPGPLGEKIRKGYPFDPNPFNSILRYLNEVDRRINYSALGFNGELVDPLINAMIAEGASPTLVEPLFRAIASQKYYPQSMRKAARILTNLQATSKMTWSWIPNLGQPFVNTVPFAGFRASWEGFRRAIRGEDSDRVLAAVALAETVARGPVRAFGEARVGPGADFLGRMESLTSRVANWYLRWAAPFLPTERWNRVWSGATGEFLLLDDGARAAAGRLKGHSLEEARRRWLGMGIDLDRVAQGIRRSGDDFLQSPEFLATQELATFRMAQQTQFIPGLTRAPMAWQHPFGRVIFQFKTFILGQSKFLADHVFAEAARGNLRPLAYWTALGVAVGEGLRDVKALALGRPRPSNPVIRFHEDVMFQGGFGLFSDTVSALYWGRGADLLLGPTVGTTIGFAEKAVQGGVPGMAGEVARMPLAQQIVRLMQLGYGAITTADLEQYLEARENPPSFDEVEEALKLRREERRE